MEKDIGLSKREKKGGCGGVGDGESKDGEGEGKKS